MRMELYTYIYTHIYIYTHVHIYMEIVVRMLHTHTHTMVTLCKSQLYNDVYMCMGWLRLVGSLKFRSLFAKEPYKRDYILQKRPIILRSPLIVATPYATINVPLLKSELYNELFSRKRATNYMSLSAKEPRITGFFCKCRYVYECTNHRATSQYRAQ